MKGMRKTSSSSNACSSRWLLSNSVLTDNERHCAPPKALQVIVAFCFGARGRGMNSKVLNSMRHKVSADKNRYQLNGYDLDFTYITDRIVGAALGWEG